MNLRIIVPKFAHIQLIVTHCTKHGFYGLLSFNPPDTQLEMIHYPQYTYHHVVDLRRKNKLFLWCFLNKYSSRCFLACPQITGPFPMFQQENFFLYNVRVTILSLLAQYLCETKKTITKQNNPEEETPWLTIRVDSEFRGSTLLFCELIFMMKWRRKNHESGG